MVDQEIAANDRCTTYRQLHLTAILIEADVLIHRWHCSEVDHVPLILIASEPLLQGRVGRANEGGLHHHPAKFGSAPRGCHHWC